MLGAFCTRLAPFFDIPEVELESVFIAIGRVELFKNVNIDDRE